MSEPQVVFPLDEIQSEFLKSRNQQAINLVEDAVRKVSVAVNVPVGIKVAPNDELTALVMVRPEPPQQTPPQPTAEDLRAAMERAGMDEDIIEAEIVDDDEVAGEPV